MVVAVLEVPVVRGGPVAPPEPGRKVSSQDVKQLSSKQNLYDEIRSCEHSFLDIQARSDWEKELADFYRTDVEVPAQLNSGRENTYPEVGVAFRGNSSFFGVSGRDKNDPSTSLSIMTTRTRTSTATARSTCSTLTPTHRFSERYSIATLPGITRPHPRPTSYTSLSMVKAGESTLTTSSTTRISSTTGLSDEMESVGKFQLALPVAH